MKKNKKHTMKNTRLNPHVDHGVFRKKKSLGQNFLKSIPALNMMCEASNLNKKDIILEIGPGKGVLTKKLLEKSKNVIAVEKDRELIKYLQEKFEEEIKSKKLILLELDILDFDKSYYQKYNLKNNNFKIIANIPYNITGFIFKKFLSSNIKPSIMTLLIQKEVAKRIIGITKINNSNNKNVGKESLLSLSVKAYGEPKYMMKVEKRFFSPSPKVDSAIISIKNISNKNFKSKNAEKRFFDLIKAGFSHKRKILKKNLESIMKNQKTLTSIFEKLKINPKVRAEEIPLETWLQINKLF